MHCNGQGLAAPPRGVFGGVGVVWEGVGENMGHPENTLAILNSACPV